MVFPFDGNAIGGVLIGVGMAITGACPGTVLVQVGIGSWHGYAVAVGGILGGLAYLWILPTLNRRRHLRLDSDDSQTTAAALNAQPPTIHRALRLDKAKFFVVWETLCLARLWLIRVYDPSRRPTRHSQLVDPVTGGVLIGISQVTAVLLTRHAIGVSTVYEDTSRWLIGLYTTTTKRSHGWTPSAYAILTPATAFATGLMLAAAFGRLTLPSVLVSAASSSKADTLRILEAVFGGAIMVLGARIAGGCTSGHGISGLAMFSSSSLVTTAAMFASRLIISKFQRGLSLT